MKKKSVSKSAFFNPRALIGALLCCAGVTLAMVALKPAVHQQRAQSPDSSSVTEPMRDMPTLGESPANEHKDLERLEQFWNDRVTYPTGKFNPAWLRNAAAQHEAMPRGVPAGSFAKLTTFKGAGLKGLATNPDNQSPAALSTTGFTALGPMPEQMTGCSGCFNYTITEGRVNVVAVDPTTTTNGSIVAYAGTVGGGVWKTTNCCSSSTSWTVVTDEPLIATIPIDTIAIDPNNHNTVYAGTGDLNYGSFSMGSQGILKTTDGGNTWTVLGASIFGPDYSEPTGFYPQYNAVGKVRVDPNNSNNVAAGTKQGVYISNDGGNTWTQCPANSFTTQRQDITGLELTDMGGGVTRILAAIGVRGFPTYVQYDLGNNGANGIYSATMPPSGCPTFTPITTNANGFVFGTAVSGSPYTTGANMNADSGNPCLYPYITAGNATYCGNGSTGGATTNGGTVNNLGRIDIAVAPSNPNVIYAQVQSINWNSDTSGSGGGGCESTAGCQLGAWYSTNGGTTWNFMAGSAGGSLQQCGSSGNANATAAGDYPQNWYDQGVAVDPNDPTRVFFQTHEIWFATQTGTVWYNTTCAYNQTGLGMHADEHAIAFVPGSSSILVTGGDGSVAGATNVNTTTLNVSRPTWFHMLNGINSIEFYAGDISGNFATSSTPQAVAGAQDNGPSSASFSGSPTGAVQWQMGLGGDGFSGLIDPMGTGPSQAQGTITLTTGGAAAGQQFTIGSQVFTFQTAARSGTGQVTLSTSTTTEGNNIVTAVNADIPSTATAARSGATVVVTATNGGSAGNSIPFQLDGTVNNFSMNGGGFLGGTTQGGLPGQNRFWEGNNSGGFDRCVSNCTAPGASWSNRAGAWTGDTQSFVLPTDLFHGGIPGGDDCQAAGPTTGCGHLIAGTTRVWETITGATGTNTWVVSNTPTTGNLTKASLGNRSYINQVKYSPKYQSVAIIGTNDGNVQIGFNLGTGTAGAGNWVNVTGGNSVLPNRPINGVSLDPSVSAANTPVGYAAIGGFNENSLTSGTPTPGHVFQVTCAANCASFNWVDKSGNLPDIPVDSVINNPNIPQQVFAGTDWGVYFTNDVTQVSPTWYRFDSGLPHAMVWDMIIDRGSTTLAVFTRSRGAYVFPLPTSPTAPNLVSVVSRLTHGGGAGTFDLPLSTATCGASGSAFPGTIEPRSDGSGNFMIVFNFDQPIVSANSSVTSGTGSVSNVSTSGSSVMVSLAGVTDQQVVTVSTSGVTGPGDSSASPSVQVGFLNGDVNGDGFVNVGDVIMERNNAGSTVNSTNFQFDVNIDGFINVGDTIIVRTNTGDSLPTCP